MKGRVQKTSGWKMRKAQVSKLPCDGDLSQFFEMTADLTFSSL